MHAAQLSGRVEALAGPTANVVLVDLVPSGGAVRGLQDPVEVITAFPVVLLLAFEFDTSRYQDYEIEVKSLRASGEDTVWSGKGIPLPEGGVPFSVSFPGGLPASELAVYLRGRTESSIEHLHRYRFDSHTH